MKTVGSMNANPVASGPPMASVYGPSGRSATATARASARVAASVRHTYQYHFPGLGSHHLEGDAQVVIDLRSAPPGRQGEGRRYGEQQREGKNEMLHGQIHNHVSQR